MKGLYEQRFWVRLTAALRTGWACLLVAVLLLYVPKIQTIMEASVLAPMIAILMAGPTLGTVLENSVGVLSVSVPALLSTMAVLHVLKPPISKVATIACTGITSYVISYLSKTNLIGRKMALAEISIVYITAHYNAHVGTIYFPLKMIVPSILGCFMAVVATLFPFPRRAVSESLQSAKSASRGTSEYFTTSVNAFCASDASAFSAVQLHSKLLAKVSAEYLTELKGQQAGIWWELGLFNRKSVNFITLCTKGLTSLNLHLTGMEIALESGYILRTPALLRTTIKETLLKISQQSKVLLEMGVKLRPSVSDQMSRENLVKEAEETLHLFELDLLSAREKAFYGSDREDMEGGAEMWRDQKSNLLLDEFLIKRKFQGRVSAYFFLFNLRLYFIEAINLVACANFHQTSTKIHQIASESSIPVQPRPSILGSELGQIASARPSSFAASERKVSNRVSFTDKELSQMASSRSSFTELGRKVQDNGKPQFYPETKASHAMEEEIIPAKDLSVHAGHSQGQSSVKLSSSLIGKTPPFPMEPRIDMTPSMLYVDNMDYNAGSNIGPVSSARRLSLDTLDHERKHNSSNSHARSFSMDTIADGRRLNTVSFARKTSTPEGIVLGTISIEDSVFSAARLALLTEDHMRDIEVLLAANLDATAGPESFASSKGRSSKRVSCCERCKHQHSPTSTEKVTDSSQPERWKLLRILGIQLSKNQMKRSLKISLSIVLATIFGTLVLKADSAPYWAAVTVAFLIGNFQGGSWRISNLRLQGTVLGSIYGFLALSLSHHHKWAILVLLIPWVVFSSFVRYSPGYGYSGLVAAFTAALLMLGDFKNDIRKFAMDRITETFVGVLCFVLVETVVFPERAVVLVRKEMVTSLIGLRDCVAAIVEVFMELECMQCRNLAVERIKHLEQELRASFAKQSVLSKEAVLEPDLWFVPFPGVVYSNLITIQGRMLDILFFMVCSLHATREEFLSEHMQNLLKPLRASLISLQKEVISTLDSLQEVLQIKITGKDGTRIHRLNRWLRHWCSTAQQSDVEQQQARPNPNNNPQHPLLVFGARLRSVDGIPLNLKSTMKTFERSVEDAFEDVITTFKANEQADQIMSNSVMLSVSSLSFSLHALLRETVHLEKAVHELLQAENPWSVLDFWDAYSMGHQFLGNISSRSDTRPPPATTTHGHSEEVIGNISRRSNTRPLPATTTHEHSGGVTE